MPNLQTCTDLVFILVGRDVLLLILLTGLTLLRLMNRAEQMSIGRRRRK